MEDRTILRIEISKLIWRRHCPIIRASSVVRSYSYGEGSSVMRHWRSPCLRDRHLARRVLLDRSQHTCLEPDLGLHTKSLLWP